MKKMIATLLLYATTACAAPITDFSFALYNAAKSEENVILSPYSVYTALAMLSVGAKGTTGEEIERALQFSGDAQKLTLPRSDLHVANALWVSNQISIVPHFRLVVESGFSATVQTLDFSDPGKAAVTINGSVFQATHGKISSLISSGDLSTDSRLVLTNAIYFAGNWAKPFDAHRTAKAPFWKKKEVSVDTPTMEQTNTFLYLEEETYQAIALPFAGKSVSFIAVLPRASIEFDDFENAFSADAFLHCLSHLSAQRVQLKLPKFTLDIPIGLKPAAQKLGIERAFTTVADFSPITGARDLCLSNVVHRSYIDVNETGVVAAAATGAIMNVTTSHKPTLPPIPFIADRPFLFFLVDTATQTPLFIGKFVTPV